MKNGYKGISGLALLRILQRVVDAWVTPPRTGDEYRPGISDDGANLVIKHPLGWLQLNGLLCVSPFSAAFCKVPRRLGFAGEWLHLGGDAQKLWSERLYLDEKKSGDLSDQEIGRQLAALEEKHGPSTIALAAQYLLAAGTTNLVPEGRRLLAFVISLMFGIESSRNNATYLTTLFMLDLATAGAKYGSAGTKTFKLSTGFDSAKQWENTGDQSARDYGGKFPMAVHGTGAGNIGERFKAISASSEEPGNDEETYRQWWLAPKRNAVPLREISLMAHWLELLEVEPNEEAIAAACYARLEQLAQLQVPRLTHVRLSASGRNKFVKTPTGVRVQQPTSAYGKPLSATAAVFTPKGRTIPTLPLASAPSLAAPSPSTPLPLASSNPTQATLPERRGENS